MKKTKDNIVMLTIALSSMIIVVILSLTSCSSISKNKIFSNTRNSIVDKIYKNDSTDKALDIDAESEIILNKLYKVKLIDVVDGDTIKVKWGNNEVSVRMIGIDTPESVHPDDAKNSPLGELATSNTKDFLSDESGELIKDVYLEFDKGSKDEYDRYLAYVWIKEGVDMSAREDFVNYSVNGYMTSIGLAVPLPIESNTKYKEFIELINQDAMSSGIGIYS